MKEIKILGLDGQPIRKETLTEEVASASMTGVRQAWTAHTIAGSLTPQRLAALLQSANVGNDYDYLTLAEEMEERDWHYGSVLGTRKRAIDGLDMVVEAGSTDTQGESIAEAVRQQVRRPLFEEMTSDLLDGIGKGRSTVEMVWGYGKLWQPEAFLWRDPRFFHWSPENAHELRLRDEADLYHGLPLAPFKFLTHAPKLKTGIPARNGLARLAAAAYMLKSFTVRDWMSFSELFGLPIRVGKYGPNASEPDKAVLRRALANLGTDAAAMIPDSMQVEFIERANTGSGHTLFKDLAEFLDRGISKTVLGQTASTEGTPGKLGNESAQDDVRDDIKKADAKQLARTLNRDFVTAFVDLNFGVQTAYPRIVVHVPDEEDIAGLVDAVDKLVTKGLKVGQGFIRDKLGIPDPEPDEELLGTGNPSPPTPHPAASRVVPQGARGVNSQQHHGGCQCAGCRGVALNSQGEAGRDAVDDFIDQEMADWQPMMASVLDDLGVSDLADAQDPEQLRDILAAKVRDMGGLDALVNALALSAFKARVDGYAKG